MKNYTLCKKKKGTTNIEKKIQPDRTGEAGILTDRYQVKQLVYERVTLS